MMILKKNGRHLGIRVLTDDNLVECEYVRSVIVAPHITTGNLVLTISEMKSTLYNYRTKKPINSLFRRLYKDEKMYTRSHFFSKIQLTKKKNHEW